jgi:hypothetical protein
MGKKLLLALAALAAGALFRRWKSPPAPRPPTACWYSASDGYGGYFEGGELRRYDPDPVEMVDAAGPVHCANRSHNGMRLRELLAGGPLANGLPEEAGDTGVTVLPFAQQLAQDQPELAVVGAGMVDWLFDDITPESYRAMLVRAASEARALDIQPVFLGFSRFALSSFITPDHIARIALGDDTLRVVAEELDVPYIDRSSVEPVMAPDGLHWTRECHEEAARVMAPQLATIAGLSLA